MRPAAEAPSFAQRRLRRPAVRTGPGTAEQNADPLVGDPGPYARALPAPMSVPRVRWTLLIGLPLLSLIGGIVAGLHGRQTGFYFFVVTLAALLVASGFILLAASLPDLTVEGVVFSVLTLAAAAMAWTHTNKPIYTWSVLAVQTVVLAAWTFPWFRDLRVLPRLGVTWIGVPAWLLGVISAVVLGRITVGGQRLIYGGIAVLTLLFILRASKRTGRDVSIGLVAGILLGLAAVTITGSGNLFRLTHYVPPGPWGARFNGRFWGGPDLVIHPNGMALAALLVAVRIAPDPRFTRWQRLSALLVAALIVTATNSRTGVLAGGVAAVAWAIVLLLRHRRTLFGHRPAGQPGAVLVLVAAALPIVLTFAVVFLAGGQGGLLKQRYGPSQTHIADASTSVDDINQGTDVSAITSGRTQNWGAMFSAFGSDSVVEKLFGNTDNTRGYLLRQSASVHNQPKLTPDSAPIAVLRRAGAVGVLFFVLGFLMLLYSVWRSRRPIWWGLLVLTAFATIATSDQVLGGTGTTLWAMLIAGEVAIFLGVTRQPAEPDTVAEREPVSVEG